MNIIAQFPKSDKNKFYKQLHQTGLSIFPIESNSKLPLLIERKLSIKNPFVKVSPNETIIDNQYVNRSWRMRRKRYINKPLTWPTIRKYLKQNTNFALLTGQEYNGGYICILDFDLKGENVEKKKELFNTWINNHPEFLTYPLTKTPNNGWQFYFISPYEINKQNIYLEGIHIGEILANGAYGLLPYSTIDNNAYEFINSLASTPLPLLDITSLGFELENDCVYIEKCFSYCVTLPQQQEQTKHYEIEIKWNKENYYQKLLNNNYKRIQHAEIGTRNNTLYEQTRMAFAVGRELNFSLTGIETFKKAALLAGLEEKEIEATFESAKKAMSTVKVTFKGFTVKKEWTEKEQYQSKIGSSLEAFEWFRTHICRTSRGEGILQNEFKQAYLSSTTGQGKLAELIGVSRQTINRWIKDWIDKGWCIKVKLNNGWCYRFGEIIQGVLHWYIDEIPFLELPELKNAILSDDNESIFLIDKELNYARGPD